MMYDGTAERLRHIADDLESEELPDHVRILRKAVVQIYALPLYADQPTPATASMED